MCSQEISPKKSSLFSPFPRRHRFFTRNQKAPTFDLLKPKPKPDPITQLLSQNRIQDAFALCARTRSLPSAIKLHSLVSSLPFSLLLPNRIFDLYSKCGSISSARKLFDSMPSRDLCSYNTLIKAYSSSSYLVEARNVFDSMPTRDHFSWSAIISAYDRHQRPLEALQLYRMYQNQNLELGEMDNKFVMSAALTAAASAGLLKYGKDIHCRVVRRRVVLDKVTVSALADMYA